MYISFDYKCPDCDLLEPRFVKKSVMDDQSCDCNAFMIRLPAGTRTTFRHADRKLKR